MDRTTAHRYTGMSLPISDNIMHPAIHSRATAVVTGGGSGIGLEAARRFRSNGMNVCIVDVDESALCALQDDAALADVLFEAVDVSDVAQLDALRERVLTRFGAVDVLMANAGIQPGSSVLDEASTWQRIIDVNLWGIVRSVQTFAPGMIDSDTPGLIITTGSKQGITTPPGDPAYNTAKSGVKAFTEALQHDLRNREGCQVEARLFIPGFVYTPLSAGDREQKPDGAWTSKQVVDFLFEALGRDEFYILCPDNDVDRATDQKRIAWAAGDIIENRPPLSRWHPDHAAAFQQWLDAGGDST